MCKKIYEEELLSILKDGVKPALGCTEPVAVGLAVAKAYSYLEGDIKKIEVRVSANIFKNGMGVGIPGTEEIGLVFASALAAVCGDADLGLEVFKPVNPDCVKEAESLVEADLIDIVVEENEGNFYIGANVESEDGRCLCEIRDRHTNIVNIELNDELVFKKEEEEESLSKSQANIQDADLETIRNFVENVAYEDIEFLLEGVKLNKEIADFGLREKSGLGLGASIKDLIDKEILPNDTINIAKYTAAAACDARMSGVNMPVMSSGASGNQGITAILTPTIVCESINCSDEKLARTLAYSHLMTAYIKSFVGNLSPVCGCAISAGIGASASITWTLGGSDEQIGGAIKNMVGTLTGLVCDGAKGGCAFKIATATSEAIIQAKLALTGLEINENDGIVTESPEETIKNLGKFSNRGMASTDREIIDIMVNK